MLDFNLTTRNMTLRGFRSKLITITSWLLLLLRLLGLLVGKLTRLLLLQLLEERCCCWSSMSRLMNSDLKELVKFGICRFNLSSCHDCTNLLKLLEDVPGIALAVPHPSRRIFKPLLDAFKVRLFDLQCLKHIVQLVVQMDLML